MTITLRIKQKWFNEIEAGRKLVEYRDVKPFYERLFARAQDVTRIRLHYQKEPMLEVQVDAIRRIPRPAKLSPEFFQNAETFAIILRNPRRIRG